jgi:hypothetical protein
MVLLNRPTKSGFGTLYSFPPFFSLYILGDIAGPAGPKNPSPADPRELSCLLNNCAPHHCVFCQIITTIVYYPLHSTDRSLPQNLTLSHLHQPTTTTNNNMANVIKNSTRIDTAVAMLIEPDDVESSLKPSVHKAIEENITIIDADDDDSAGMVGMGIVMFILILGGTVSSFFIPYLSSACYFAVILTCECYYTTKTKYNLNEEPHVNKRLATSTLITLILLFILLSCETPVYYLDETTTVGTTFISSDAQKVIFYISLVLIYCGIFTWYCPLRCIFIIVLCTCHFVVRIVD